LYYFKPKLINGTLYTDFSLLRQIIIALKRDLSISHRKKGHSRGWDLQQFFIFNYAPYFIEFYLFERDLESSKPSRQIMSELMK